jgi:hypothetical protein
MSVARNANGDFEIVPDPPLVGQKNLGYPYFYVERIEIPSVDWEITGKGLFMHHNLSPKSSGYCEQAAKGRFVIPMGRCLLPDDSVATVTYSPAYTLLVRRKFLLQLTPKILLADLIFVVSEYDKTEETTAAKISIQPRVFLEPTPLVYHRTDVIQSTVDDVNWLLSNSFTVGRQLRTSIIREGSDYEIMPHTPQYIRLTQHGIDRSVADPDGLFALYGYKLLMGESIPNKPIYTISHDRVDYPRVTAIYPESKIMRKQCCKVPRHRENYLHCVRAGASKITVLCSGIKNDIDEKKKCHSNNMILHSGATSTSFDVVAARPQNPHTDDPYFSIPAYGDIISAIVLRSGPSLNAYSELSKCRLYAIGRYLWELNGESLFMLHATYSPAALEATRHGLILLPHTPITSMSIPYGQRFLEVESSIKQTSQNNLRETQYHRINVAYEFLHLLDKEAQNEVFFGTFKFLRFLETTFTEETYTLKLPKGTRIVDVIVGVGNKFEYSVECFVTARTKEHLHVLSRTGNLYHRYGEVKDAPFPLGLRNREPMPPGPEVTVAVGGCAPGTRVHAVVAYVDTIICVDGSYKFSSDS